MRSFARAMEGVNMKTHLEYFSPYCEYEEVSKFRIPVEMTQAQISLGLLCINENKRRPSTLLAHPASLVHTVLFLSWVPLAKNERDVTLNDL